jgi:molecular chaperone DnaK
VRAWLERAHAEIDKRYAPVWGLDLGTTKCCAAVYDVQAGAPVICTWKGHNQIPSTLCITEDGEELVGLSREECFGRGVIAQITASKRKMGSQAVYKVRQRLYRAEEVAARLIAHARRVVEDFLGERVRERVRALAGEALGEVPEEWLDSVARAHPFRPARPRAVVTIPAYFRNNQKHATRDASLIAGIEPVRMLHEPTAAALAVGHSRRLGGDVVVVDLGAGTLDVSAIHVEDELYEVTQVLGNNAYGGKSSHSSGTSPSASPARAAECAWISESHLLDRGPEETSGRWGPYRQASPPPARHRPGRATWEAGEPAVPGRGDAGGGQAAPR